MWAAKTACDEEQVAACQERIQAFQRAIEQLFLPAWSNGTRYAHAGPIFNDINLIRWAAGEMHWQLLQQYKDRQDPMWIVQCDLDPYVLAAHINPFPDVVDIGALLSAAESSRLPGMGESHEDSTNSGESPNPILLGPPEAEPDNDDLMSTTSETTFALVTETPECICYDPNRRWKWPSAEVESTPTQRPVRVVGPMPDFANMHYEVLSGDGLTVSSVFDQTVE